MGSRSLVDAENDSQVDGVAAFRSPGSTLKPFVYAQALDRRIIGVNTLLSDTPVEYGDWAPLNFDGEFNGVVSARDALVRSLNIPAVQLMEKLEPDGLINLLHHAGFAAFRSKELKSRFGLSTVLGGCEVRLIELTNLYATLAQGGLHRLMNHRFHMLKFSLH